MKGLWAQGFRFGVPGHEQFTQGCFGDGAEILSLNSICWDLRS